ncbi:hypothetical protein V5P93_004678 [Actinokineospora auranticolor]|uniref:Uncharacterized protein n=1 Tax=Actinokineospora auranticolor TaxID=155976 RepID=A0A2S6GN19_9PSEU|nr:transcriptional regulator [Actinokineospora auranticolor]PPK66639.1 hypothetical protein CLV40_10924 [Actinokineospora auranticolor]
MPTADDWLAVRAYLAEHRHTLAVDAVAEYPDTPTVAGTPLLTTPSWLPPEPVQLTAITLHRGGSTRFAAPPAALPEPHRTYSSAMAALAAPAVFQNRATYRLLDADLSVPRVDFGAGTYFDGIDFGEACAHEYAARRLGLVDALDLRDAIGAPCDPTRRPTNVAISTLTLRVDRHAGTADLYLHWRDPKRVGHAGGLYQVVPVGVFQPAADDRADFSLWRCVVREFSEELLGTPETAPTDYDRWPFAARLTGELGTRVRVTCLGMGVDPLTLATDLLTVAAIDAEVFDDLFGTPVDTNDEGRVLDAQPFTEDTITRFVHHEPTQAAGAALLALAWAHRDTLLA